MSPDKFGQVENLVSQTSDYGEDRRKNDFFNISFNARLPRGVTFGGGFDTGRTVGDRCFVVDSPQELLHCKVVTPFSAQTQVKLFGAYPLPWDTAVSFAYQNLSGPSFDANYAATNEEIAPSLGRDLAGGARVATVPLVAPQTLFEDRITRLDFRVSKVLYYGRVRAQMNFDAYNLMNANSVRSVISTYGPRWQTPNQIMDPRLFEIGGQISF